MTLWANWETGDSWADLPLRIMLGALKSPNATSLLLKLLRLGVAAVPGRGEVFCEEAISDFEDP